MKLIELDPRFLHYNHDDSWQEFPTLEQAQGIIFDCPKCTGEKSHSVAVSFRDRGVLDHQGSHDSEGKPSRWQVSGTGFHDLTLQPSIDLTHSLPDCWHGFITAGEVT